MSMSHMIKVVTVIAALGVSAVGCSKDAPPLTTSATSEKPLVTLASSSTTPTTPLPPSPDISPAPVETCNEAATLWDAVLQAEADIEEDASQEVIDQLNVDAEKLKTITPSQIQADMDTWRAASAKFIAKIKEVLGTEGELDPSRAFELQQAQVDRQAPAVEQAVVNIDTYLSTCS